MGGRRRKGRREELTWEWEKKGSPFKRLNCFEDAVPPFSCPPGIRRECSGTWKKSPALYGGEEELSAPPPPLFISLLFFNSIYMQFSFLFSSFFSSLLSFSYLRPQLFLLRFVFPLLPPLSPLASSPEKVRLTLSFLLSLSSVDLFFARQPPPPASSPAAKPPLFPLPTLLPTQLELFPLLFLLHSYARVCRKGKRGGKRGEKKRKMVSHKGIKRRERGREGDRPSERETRTYFVQ